MVMSQTSAEFKPYKEPIASRAKNQTKILRMFVCPICNVELDICTVSDVKKMGWKLDDSDNRFVSFGKCRRCGRPFDVYLEVNHIEVKEGCE